MGLDEEEGLALREAAAQIKTMSSERVRVYRILIRTSASATDNERKRALKTAAEIKKRLDGGEEFAKVAKEESEEPESAARGGDIGYVLRGVAPPELEKAVFSMGVGEISAPIATEVGYHIVRVTEKRADETPDFDRFKDDLANFLGNVSFQKSLESLVKGLREKSVIERHLPTAPKTLAFTCGDPAGVGPLAVIAALRAHALPAGVAPVLVGESSVWRRAGWRAADGHPGHRWASTASSRYCKRRRRTSPPPPSEALRLVARGLAAGSSPRHLQGVLGRGGLSLARPYAAFGGLRAGRRGDGARRALARALVRAGDASCVSEGGGPPRRRARDRVGRACLASALRRLGKPRPRLALCALNPHGGEKGLIGREEGRGLLPRPRSCAARDCSSTGPCPRIRPGVCTATASTTGWSVFTTTRP